MDQTYFMQWNVQGLRTSKEDILYLIDTYNPLILALQETQCNDNYMISFSGYHCISKQGHWNRRQHGGVALYIDNSCPFEQIQVPGDQQIVAARICIDGYRMITIVSVYAPGRTPFNINNFTDTIRNLPSPVVIMGDLNAHHPRWFNDRTDRRGRELEEMISQLQLHIVNEDAPTYETDTTTIDVTLSSANIAGDLDWMRLVSVMDSDHYPILIRLNTIRHNDNRFAENYNFKKGRWEDYQNDHMWNFDMEEIDSPCNLLEKFYHCYEQLRDKWVPKSWRGRFFPKPWWNSECQSAFRERERLYRIFKRTQLDADKVRWKRARASAKLVFTREKKRSWQNYVSLLNPGTPSSRVWDMVRRIRGRPPRRIPIIKIQNNVFSSISDIVNKLAETFQQVSSDDNYSQSFIRHKRQEESYPLHFQSDNTEEYNAVFSIHELQRAIDSSKNTAPGPDNVSNTMIRHMPEAAKEVLLRLYNSLWTSGYFPAQWRKSTIVPIPKPGKDHTNPNNHRPISLTSCLCKTYEKMINRRLVEYLENNKMLARIQCGFRRYRATIDHLVRFDTYVRKALAGKLCIMAVFFDLEKAYDMTWRYGTMRDLHTLGLRGRLPLYIQEFLRDRTFRVRIDNVYSDECTPQAGIPQGSTLSVTLFAIKINNLASVIPEEVFASMFVDDALIAYSDHNTDLVEAKMQRTINRMSEWADKNGFRFSSSKTKCMLFYEGSEPVRKPMLHLGDAEIELVKSKKFLGLDWDHKLAWDVHIKKLKARCMKDLSLLRSVSSEKWGAEQHVLMRLYRSIIRPKIDYGSIVYGSALPTVLGHLDVVVQEAMRISFGAFRSTHTGSLYVIANEPPLRLRRQDLLLRYYYKLKCHITNPAYNQVVNRNLETYFQSRNCYKPVIMRLRSSITELNVPTQPIMPYKTPDIFSWTMHNPIVDDALVPLRSSDTPGEIVRGLHQDHMQQYHNTKVIYTDGSKSATGVGSAAYMDERHFASTSLPTDASIQTAELYAIQLALRMVEEDSFTDFTICSDSLSSLQTFRNPKGTNILIEKLFRKIHELNNRNKQVVLTWVPSHVGIEGNERADQLAKEAATREATFTPIPYTDFYNTIRQRVYSRWKELWRENPHGRHLYQVRSEPGPWLESLSGLSRRECVILNRIRLGHTRLTHGYLFENGIPTRCPLCGAVLTVPHLIVECPELGELRDSILRPGLRNEGISCAVLLRDRGPKRKVLTFLQQLGVSDSI